MARQPGEPLRPGFNMFSKQQDMQLGQEAAQQVRQQYQVVQNQFLQDYIQRVGQRLASTPEAKQSGFPFSFTLLNVGEVNAFALPGGPAFVFTGLLKVTDNEAQLAGVLAHELSHVILRHGTNQASKANLIKLPAMLAGAAAGGSMLGQLTQLGIGLGANSVLLHYSRDAESQADALGSHLMSEAGFNPIEMARFFEKLNAQGGGSRGLQFLSDHPNPGNRERAIEAEIRTLPQRSYDFDTGSFQQAKSLVGGLPAPPARRTSSIQTPGQGSAGGWQKLQSKSFAVSYPGSWRAFGESDSSSVTVAPQEGLVRNRNGTTAVGYGAILSYFFPESGRADLRTATDELIHHLHADNPSMRVAPGDARTVRVDGSEGLVTMIENSSPFGGAETDALLTVWRPEGLFYMVFIAPSQDFRQLQPAFQQMINSIRFNS